MGEQLRVGLVGAGAHALRNVLPALHLLRVRLVAVADPSAEARERVHSEWGQVALYSSSAEMYAHEKLDAVLLCVSAKLHPDLAIEAFGAGLPVWMEKPSAALLSDADRMLAAQGDLIAAVGYKKVFTPAAVKARELIDDGALGTVRSVLAQYPLAIPRCRPTDPEARRWLDSCHPVSLLLSLSGPVVEVTTHRVSPDGLGGGTVVLRHTSGGLSTLHLPPMSKRLLGQPFERYTIFGTEGTIEIANSRRITFQRGIEFDYGNTTSFAPAGLDSGAIVWEAQDSLGTPESKTELTQGQVGGLANFFDAVAEHRPPITAGLDFARQVVAIFEAALLSDATPVPLALTNLGP